MRPLRQSVGYSQVSLSQVQRRYACQARWLGPQAVERRMSWRF